MLRRAFSPITSMLIERRVMVAAVVVVQVDDVDTNASPSPTTDCVDMVIDT